MAKNSKGNLGQVSKYNIVDAGDAIIWLKLQTRGFVIAKCQRLKAGGEIYYKFFGLILKMQK
jgi:hypothetical protein